MSSKLNNFTKLIQRIEDNLNEVEITVKELKYIQTNLYEELYRKKKRIEQLEKEIKKL